MEENLKHIELIEAYHEGKLSAAEKVDFEVRLLVDQELQEENELYKKVLYSFHDIKADKIRVKLRQIDEELDKKKKGGSGRGWFYWMAGVAAIVAIGFIIFQNFFLQPRFTTDLIPSDSGLPVLMGNESRLDFDNAMSQFKAGQYENAIHGFCKSLVTNPGNDTTLFYLGNCYLHTGNYTKSIETLSHLSRQPNSIYFNKGQYYLALAYWADGKNEKAHLIFAEIANTAEHPFQAKSKVLLKKIH